jgi:signal transduction histidine kinase
MENSTQPSVKTGSNADLGFAVVVLASYFATFSSLQNASPLEIFIMITAGIGYVSIGIYGYAQVSQIKSQVIRLGYFLIQLLLGGVILFLGKGAGFNAMVLLPLAAQSVILLSKAWIYTINIAIIATYSISAILFATVWTDVWAGLQIFLAGQIFVVIFTQMVVKEENNRKVIEKLANELKEANQNLRMYALQVEELATTKERNRLAREIHDGLGHYLTSIHMQLQAANAVMEGDTASLSETINTARNLTQDALKDVRQSVAALRAPPDENQPLSDRMANLIENSQITGVRSEFILSGTQRNLPSEVQWTLYRAAQEGFSNTSKHAQAANFWIILDYSDVDQVHLTIQDDGVGCDDIEAGFGLLGIQERLHLLEGNLQISSSPDKGFKIEISIPG